MKTNLVIIIAIGFYIGLLLGALRSAGLVGNDFVHGGVIGSGIMGGYLMWKANRKGVKGL